MRFTIREDVLDNGLRIVQAHVPAQDATIIAHVNAGVVYEPSDLNGISHFCEHVMYKGTPTMPSREEVYARSDLMGGRRQARTVKQRAEFGTRVVLSDAQDALSWLSEILYEASFRDEDIESEKGVVLEELRGEHNNPQSRLWKDFYIALFDGSELSQHVPGTEESVKAYKPWQVKAFYNQFFNPKNTTLLVASPHDFDTLAGMVDGHFGDYQGGEFQEIPVIRQPENEARDVKVNLPFGAVHIAVGRLVPHARTDEAYALRVVGDILGKKVFNTLVNQESCSYVASGRYNDQSNLFGTFQVNATCAPDKHQRVKELIMDEMENVRAGKFSDEDVKRAVELLSKDFIFGNDNTQNIALNMLKFNTTGNVYELNTFYDNLRKVTPAAVREAAEKNLAIDDLTIVRVGNIE